MKLAVFLHSEVGCFSLNEAQEKRLRESLKDWDGAVVRNRDDFLRVLPEAEAVATWSFKAEWYARAPRLKALFTPAAGKDWVEADPAGRITTRHGAFHGNIMSETLLAMILYFGRRLDAAKALQERSAWDREPFHSTSVMSRQTVVIVGYGEIGRHCARLLKPFGCRVVGVKRSPLPDQKGLADELVSYSGLETALKDADHVALILPSEARGAITAKHFGAMKRGAYLYNIGRGTCYDESELVRALTDGMLAGAGLDVFATEPLPKDSPLWSLQNVLILPHASAMAKEYLDFYLNELIPGIKEVV
jgi:phosphoglycerate dehydrogenase-like enzyme